MKKLKFSLFFSFLLVIGVANAQSETDSCTQHSPLKREKFRLAVDMPNGSVLKKDELKFMLSNDQFEAYNYARGRYVASIPLLSVGTTYFTLGSIFLGMWFSFGLPVKNAGLAIIFLIVSPLCYTVSLSFLIPGITLIVNSKNRLNNIVNDYNSQYKLSYQPVKLHFGFVGNGIGLKLTF